MQSSNRFVTLNFLWISLVLMVILSIVFLLPVTPNDYWWYLRLGKDVVSQGSVPTVDTYSYTQAGQPVFNPSWLAAVLMYGLQQAGGLTLTVLVCGLCIAAFYLFLWLACYEMGAGPLLASGLVLLAAMAGSANWSVRPQLFAYPLFGLTLWLLTRWQHGRLTGLWLLPVIAGLWANLHGSFFLFFALTGAAFIAGKGPRRLILILLGISLLATFINPSGPSAWWLGYQITANPSNLLFSREWAPATNTNWQMNLYFGWLLLFPLLIARSPRRLTVLEWLWFLGMGWLGLSGLRYVIWDLGVLAVISAALLAQWLGLRPARLERGTIPVLNLGVGAICLLFSLALLPSVRQGWWQDAPPVLTNNTPVAAVKWLKSHPDLPGPLWADIVFSSYLIAQMPERPVWADTRFYPFPVDQLQRYLQICDAAPGWENALNRDNVRLLLLDPGSQPRLIETLKANPGWKQNYQDPDAIIFVKTN